MTELAISSFRPRDMSGPEMHDLADMIRKPFNWYAPDSTTDDILKLVRGKGDSTVLVVFRDSFPLGFLAFEPRIYGSASVCYHIGVSILEDAWGQGIYTRLIDQSLSSAQFDYLAARTQNPRIYELLLRRAFDGRIYPSMQIENIPDFVVEMARDLCDTDEPHFEAESFVVRGVYGYVRSDRSYMQASDERIQRFFHHKLARNDGFIVIATLR